jgi:UDP-GlcNAc:undecaprenyl-phosphate/decaprenyl-phosphate GlcNAc-1-phosphate transferase
MAGLLAAVILVSFIVSLVFTRAMHWASPKLGLVANPGAHRKHETPTPCGGGIAIFLGLWIPIWAGVLVCLLARSGYFDLPVKALTPYLDGIYDTLPRLGLVFLGAFVIWAIGLADDIWGLSPWLRLLVHIGVGLMLLWGGMNISVYIDSPLLRGIVTVLWITGLINSFNMLDNMDGLTAGVAMIIAAAFCVVALQTGSYLVAGMLCCVIGAGGGFLLYNFNPASIFMGDSGSTQFGYLLAVLTVQFTFFRADRPHFESPFFPIIVPLLMFGLPLFDTITVVWSRLREGRSPWEGDTNHFSHRLVALGMSKRQAVLLIYLVTATIALGATVLYYCRSEVAMLVIFAQAVAIFAIIGILERVRPKEKTPK